MVSGWSVGGWLGWWLMVIRIAADTYLEGRRITKCLGMIRGNSCSQALPASDEAEPGNESEKSNRIVKSHLAAALSPFAPQAGVFSWSERQHLFLRRS